MKAHLFFDRQRFCPFLYGIYCLLLVILSWGCQGDSSNHTKADPGTTVAGSVSLAIQWHTRSDALHGAAVRSGQAIGDCGAAGVVSITSGVYDRDSTLIARGGPWGCDSPGRSGTIEGITAGPDRLFTVLGWDGADGTGNIIYLGRSAQGINLPPGETVDVGIIDAYALVPAGLGATAVSESEIGLSWTTPSQIADMVAGYRIYTDSDEVGTTDSTSYNVSGLDTGTEYCYKVLAYDIYGNASGQCDQACATPSQEQPVKSWSHPSDLSDNISPEGSIADYPQVAMDNAGNAIVVWSQTDGANAQIFMSEYRNNIWTHPGALNENISPDGSEAHPPKVAMDVAGNAIVVWHQTNEVFNDQIFISEYRNNVWTHPSSLNDKISVDDEHDFLFPQVAMDAAGNAIVAYYDLNAIFISEYRNNQWNHPSDLNDHIDVDRYPVAPPQVAMDAAGNTILAWSSEDRPNSTRYKGLFLSEYRNDQWSHPVDFSDIINPGVVSVAPYDFTSWGYQVAMDNAGNAIVVWKQLNDSRNAQVFMSAYRDNVWTHPSDLNDNISQDGTNADSPQVAMDSAGNAVVVWMQSDGSNDQIFMSEYRNNQWRHPGNLDDNISPDGTIVNSPRVAMDAAGNAVVVWQQIDDSGTHQIFMSEYRNNEWTHPSGLNDNISPDGTYAHNPQVAIDAAGNTIVVWHQSDGLYNQIFMSEYR